MASSQHFIDDGHRWALQTLITRSEVACMMEDMLGTIEHWKLVNEMELYRFQLAKQQEEVNRIKELNAELLEAKESQERKSLAMKEMAKGVRDRLVEDLIIMSVNLKAREAKEKKVHDLQCAADRVPKLVKELTRLQKEFKEAQKRLTQYKKYVGRGGAGSSSSGSGLGRRQPSLGSMDGLIGYGGITGGSRSHSPSPDMFLKTSSTTSIGTATRSPSPVIITSPRAIVEEDEHGLFTTFMTLEELLLLRVFSFLNAQDVLSTAEVCKSFYDRVGAIFGKPSLGTASGDGGVDSFSQQQQGQQQEQAHIGGAITIIPPSKASVAAKSVLEGMPITDKLATSIASKLSGAELKGIIAMTEKLRKLEAVLMQMQAENEDIRARWQGTESVKDFLIAKLKDTEFALKKSMDGVSGAARQRSSDQEVISFLDGRVQELELALQTTADRFSELQEQHGKDKLMNQEQIRVLTDMLAFEKQKSDEAESQFRNQKKILAKEIKSLRSELMGSRAERDSYREELQRLRQSLASFRR